MPEFPHLRLAQIEGGFVSHAVDGGIHFTPAQAVDPLLPAGISRIHCLKRRFDASGEVQPGVVMTRHDHLEASDDEGLGRELADNAVADHELIGFAKVLQYFDDHIADLHREYARQLLTHRNPYTGAEYRAEPAVAIVELVNENSIVEAFFSGRLRGKHASRKPGTWADITAHYAALLDGKFNAWLAANCEPGDLARWRAEAGV